MTPELRKELRMTPEFFKAVAENLDEWIPACGGHEVPFTYNRTRYLYCFKPSTHEHAYLNLDTDLIEWNPVFAV